MHKLHKNLNQDVIYFIQEIAFEKCILLAEYQTFCQGINELTIHKITHIYKMILKIQGSVISYCMNTLNALVNFNRYARILHLMSSSQYLIFDGLVPDCINSIANALELLQSCTQPSICAVLLERIQFSALLKCYIFYIFSLTKPVLYHALQNV